MSSATSTDQSFSVGHFFILLSLLAATVAVFVARPGAPESLILISLTVGAAGFAAPCLYPILAPLVAPHTAWEPGPSRTPAPAAPPAELPPSLPSIHHR